MNAALFTSPDSANSPPSAPIVAEMTRIICDTARNSARSQQTTIGPSEIGNPCARRISYRLMGTKPVNTDTDPWPSTVGTAVHAWLEEAFLSANTPGQEPVWIVEQRLPITAAISGSCDLFHVPTRQVIDHKVVGLTSLKKYKAQGPGQSYRSQIHLYGYGWHQLGMTPELVTIVFYSRSGWLSDTWAWSEPYDPEIPARALKRLAQITDLLFALDLENHPQRWEQIPADFDSCRFCPFWRAGAPADHTGCPGQHRADVSTSAHVTT